MKGPFFSSNFSAPFTWKERFSLKVGSVSAQNRKQIADGLKELSHESIRNRFMGSKKDFTEEELQYLTVVDGWNHYAIGIEEAGAKRQGIAVARLVRSSEFPQEAEVAITIMDKYQRAGLGSFLMKLLILAAKERNLTQLSFTCFPQNEAIIKLIKRFGDPIRGLQTKDSSQLILDIDRIDALEIKSQLKKTLPVIEKFSHFKNINCPKLFTKKKE